MGPRPAMVRWSVQLAPAAAALRAEKAAAGPVDDLGRFGRGAERPPLRPRRPVEARCGAVAEARSHARHESFAVLAGPGRSNCRWPLVRPDREPVAPAVPSLYPESAEEFLATRGAEEEVRNDVPVEEVLPLSEEGRDLLEELRRIRRPRGHISLAVLKVWSAWELRAMPMEARVPARRPIPLVRLHKPTAAELFECVRRNQPALITGALTEEDFPPLREFPDFDYLRARCGERCIRVKGDFFRDRAGREIYVSDPAVELTLSEFLDRIEESEYYGSSPSVYMGKVRLQDQVPEMAADIDMAPISPLGLYGSCFGENLEGVHTYFGCGRNATSVHCDPGENLLIVICGEKTFDLFPPTDVDILYPVRPPSYLCSSVPPLTPPNAMPKSVEDRCPLYSLAQPIKVHLEAGDMFYLPPFWWHGVSGGATRNMILNWWCEPHPDKQEATPESEGARGVLADISRELTALQAREA